LLGKSSEPQPAGNGKSHVVPVREISQTRIKSDRVVIRRSSDTFASLPALDFFGQFARSPNGRFTLLWNDHATINGKLRGGRYILIDDGRVVLDRGMSRPQDGKIADNGTFILHDWGELSQLSGTFHAFAPDGREIISRSFAANLYNNGLSGEGAFAVCQTCNSSNSSDSSVLCVYDLVQGQEIACWRPETGWAKDYTFPGNGRVRLIRLEGIPAEYSLQGEFLNRQKCYADDISRGSYYAVRNAFDAGEAISGVGIDALRRGAELAIAAKDERWKAVSFRLLGEIEERAGNDLAALRAYNLALALNPKVGIAKKAAALTKRLGN
jgi:hypothetical protein